MVKITILYGAIREGRLSVRAARAVENAFKNSGKAMVTFLDLKDYELPVMEQRLKDMERPPQNLLSISRSIEGADGLVLVTPEYNGSYSGAFKNCIDYFTTEYDRKPMGVVCASDGRLGGVNASHHLQQLILSIGGIPMPYKLLVPDVEHAFSEAGEPLMETAGKTLDKFVSEFLWFTGVIAAGKKAIGAKPSGTL